MLGSAMAMFVFATTNIYPLALACMTFLGFSLVTMAVTSQSLVQNAVDTTKRARVISFSTGMAVGFPALGALAMGVTAFAVAV
jgi:hypothetical protein